MDTGERFGNTQSLSYDLMLFSWWRKNKMLFVFFRNKPNYPPVPGVTPSS
jgi:hypothetical protein